MNNEKGFATILGLCLILVMALLVKGIQEAETNHAYETTDFQTEFDLKNAADSGIYEAAKKVFDDPENPDILFLNTNPYKYKRKNSQKKILTKNFSDGNIAVEVWCERIFIKHFEKKYPSYEENPKGSTQKAYTLVSKAETTDKRTGGKIYSRSFAYVLLTEKEFEDEDGNKTYRKISDTKIHFMELPSTEK